MAGREILEPYNLHYLDLISLSSSPPLISSRGEIQRLETVTREILQALGPTGPGLITITGVPNTSPQRNTLLPLARDLSLLNNQIRKPILKDHGLGSDVPLKNLDRCVSSFAMQLKYGDGHILSNLRRVSADGTDKGNSVLETVTFDGLNDSMDNHFKDLGHCFRELGLCMTDLGLRVARICDRAIGGNELERSLLESGTAKGRLIHYHSALDTCIIKGSGRRMGSKNGRTECKPEGFIRAKEEYNFKQIGQMHRGGDGDVGACEKVSDLWQQWHYDYGTFTVLTSPMFIRPMCGQTVNGEDVCAKLSGSECPSPSGHTYLQILHPNKKHICFVKAPPESFILQVGESADILSKSKLRSTLHSVSRPVELEYLSRETFVVFLHPAWNKVFHISDYPMEQSIPNGQCGEERQKTPGREEEVEKLEEEIHKIIPPLSSRLKDGMTFAEFSRETTKKYYGGNGLQTNK